MNEHATIDPKTGIDRNFAEMRRRAERFMQKVQESDNRPKEG